MRAGFWYALRLAIAPFVAYWLGGAVYVVLWFVIDWEIGIALQVWSSNKLGVRQAMEHPPNASAVARLEAMAGAVAGRINVARPDVVLPLNSALGWENALAARSAKRGTMILVSQRMLEDASPEAVAAAIAHELGHVRPFDFRLHRAALYSRLYVPLALGGAAVALPPNSWGVLVPYVYLRVALDLIARALSRLCEHRADAFAVSGGFGPDLARLFEWQMAHRPRGRRELPAGLSSHLKTAPRAARLSSSSRGETEAWSVLLRSVLADAHLASQAAAGRSGEVSGSSPATWQRCQHCGYGNTPPGKINCYNCGRRLDVMSPEQTVATSRSHPNASPAAVCQHCGYRNTPPGKINCYNCGRRLMSSIDQPAAE